MSHKSKIYLVLYWSRVDLPDAKRWTAVRTLDCKILTLHANADPRLQELLRAILSVFLRLDSILVCLLASKDDFTSTLRDIGSQMQVF